ncbi:TELO2-interacting protein 2-like isoform 2-T2 [Dama dama]
MEPEHRLLLRRTYARNLAAFVKRLGILSVRHLKRLERVIIGYLEVYDGPEEEARLKMLETLKLLLQYTWPSSRKMEDHLGIPRTPDLLRTWY